MGIVNYKGNNNCFINPYNFISVDFDKEPARENTETRKGKHSGEIHCRLITKTPICIPDVAGSDLSKDHKEFNFMRNADGIPMIPGSSIRGPIRSMFEACTNSCLSTVDVDESITYRTKTPFKPGLIYLDGTGEIHLFRAKRYIFKVTGGSYCEYKEPGLFSVPATTLRNYKYGDEVYIKALMSGGKEKEFRTKNGYPTKSIFIQSMSRKPSVGMITGYICIGEPFSKRKHFESVFVKGSEVALPRHTKGESVLKNSLKDLDRIVKTYNDDTINRNLRNMEFYKDRKYKTIKPEHFYPIWYRLLPDNENIERVHLSVASLGRSAYSNSMGDMLKDYKSCKNRGSVCPACSLFGMVGDTSIGSRVRFSDAIMDKRVPLSDKVVLRELSTPKPSYIPFYLKRLKEYDSKDISYDNKGYVLRGRKFYWHNSMPGAYTDSSTEAKAGKRNASAELVQENNVFDFSVYYENLSQEEIDELVWVITLGENREDGIKCHKIGRGKPIGLGSVKITVSSIDDRTFSDGEYSVAHTEDVRICDNAFIDPETLRQIEEMTDMESCKYQVNYPGIVNARGDKVNEHGNSDAAHQWFTSNYTLGKPPKTWLPEIGNENDPNHALKWMTMERDSENKTKKHGYHKNGIR